MAKLKRVTVTSHGRTFTLVEPSASLRADINNVQAKKIVECMKSNAPFRRSMTDYFQKNGMWSQEQEDKLKGFDRDITEMEKKLTDIARNFSTKEEVFEFACKLKKLRLERMRLSNQKNELDSITAEGQAENEALNYGLIHSVYDEKEEKVFNSIEDFLSCNEEWLYDVVNKFTYLYYPSIQEDWANHLIENRVLVKIGRMDDKNNLLRVDGKRVSIDGKLVDESGRYVNESGELVNENGLRVDEKGDIIISDDVPLA